MGRLGALRRILCLSRAPQPLALHGPDEDGRKGDGRCLAQPGGLPATVHRAVDWTLTSRQKTCQPIMRSVHENSDAPAFMRLPHFSPAVKRFGTNLHILAAGLKQNFST